MGVHVIMASNAARKYVEQQAQPEQYQARTKQQAFNHPHVAFSTFERCLIGACTVIVTIMMVSVVSTKNAVSRQTHVLQSTQQQLSAAKTRGNSDQQAINELTSEEAMTKAAKKYGLQNANTNVRNVNK